MNTNADYMRKPNAEPPNTNYNNNYNNSEYGKGRAYSNRDRFSWNNNYFYGGGKKNEKNIETKPMFTNSKLENNGNPEGNFVKIDVISEEKKYNLANIGEVPIKDSGTNSLLAIKSLLVGKEPDKNKNIANQVSNENNNNDKQMPLSMPTNSNTNNNLNDNASSSLPWRSGASLQEKGGGWYQKDYYNKNYRSRKNDNYYYFSSGKNYNKNRYSLNQPKSKKSNKFD